MNPKMSLFLALVWSVLPYGCSTYNHLSFPNYESELSYWRQLPYPRLEKLINQYDPDKADIICLCQDYYHCTKVEAEDIKQEEFAVVIEFWRNVEGKPEINEIYKREYRPEGRITRKARISVLGQLEWEEEYLNGEKSGIWYFWHTNGKLYAVQGYAHGVSQGLGLTLSPTGKVLVKCHYADGKLVTSWCLDRNGKWVKCADHGNGYMPSFSENGDENGFDRFLEGECVGGNH